MQMKLGASMQSVTLYTFILDTKHAIKKGKLVCHNHHRHWRELRRCTGGKLGWEKNNFPLSLFGTKVNAAVSGSGQWLLYLLGWMVRFWIRAMEGKLFLCSFSFSCQVDGLMFLRKFFWRDVPPYSEGHFRLHCGLPNRKIIQFVFIVYFVLQWKLWKNASNYGNVKWGTSC